MKIWLPLIYLTYIYEDHPINIQTIETMGECFANLRKWIHATKRHQTRKKYPFVYKFTGKVGPLTVAIEDKSLRCIFV